MQGAPDSPVVFMMIMDLVLRDLVRTWNARNLSWSIDGFVLPSICYADDVALVAGSVRATEMLVEETMGKLREVGLTVGCGENLLDKPTEENTQLYHGRRSAGDV